jgi:hypothetical protein
MQLPNASQEQNSVIQALQHSNVVVDSVAGSGKTTTILHIGKTYNTSPILVVTYNSRLKTETREKVKLLDLNNVEVHSYHAYCCKYYDHKCQTDKVINDIIRWDKRKLKRLVRYDYIILDEAQDVTPIYYQLIHKIIRDNKKLPKICILGDRYQSIFGFNYADERFIVYASRLFSINGLPFTHTELATSFRLTKENADFLNKCILNTERIKTLKSGPKPRYIVCDCFGNIDTDRPFEEVKYYLKSYKNEDIFILAPSVKSEKSPVRQLANRLSDSDIKIYVPNSDEEKLDEDIIKGKIVFSTFHQTKGLERKVVIVFGFDSSYFKLFKKDKNPNVCPNEIYVACTRSIDCLSVLHHYDNDYFKFLQQDKLKDYCYFEENVKVAPKGYDRTQFETSVTDLLRHLSSEVIDKALSYLEYTIVKPKTEHINIDIKRQQEDLWENVSEITGVAIPSYFELKNTGSMTIWTKITGKSTTNDANIDSYMFINDTEPEITPKEIDKEEWSLQKINLSTLTAPELLYIANEYCALRSGYIYKLKQIKEYTWLSQQDLDTCCQRLNNLISKDSTFEKELELQDQNELFNRKLKGVIDCIDNDKIYEFKCVKEIQPEHILQLAIYAYMHEMINKKKLEHLNKIIPTIVYNYKFRYKETLFVRQNGICKYIKDLKDNHIAIQNINNIVVKVHRDQIISCQGLEKKLSTYQEEQSKLANIKYKYYLLNILSDEMYELKVNLDRIIEMVRHIIYYKYFNTHTITDNEFIERNLANIDKYKTLKKVDHMAHAVGIFKATNQRTREINKDYRDYLKSIVHLKVHDVATKPVHLDNVQPCSNPGTDAQSVTSQPIGAV